MSFKFLVCTILNQRVPSCVKGHKLTQEPDLGKDAAERSLWDS